MYPLVESIAINNGKIMHLKWHELRFIKSYKSLYGKTPTFNLIGINKLNIPPLGLHKMRVEYNATHTQIDITPYTERKISRLKLITCDNISYGSKYTDRNQLNNLYEQRAGCDDILIQKNGFITDTSIGNIIFYNGQRWVTPNTPLLKGTARARLLEEGLISAQTIKAEDLNNFSCFQVINAMREMHMQVGSKVEGITI